MEPDGPTATFARTGPGRVYLAWLPLESLKRSEGRLSILLTAFEMRTDEGVVRSDWPRGRAPALDVRVRPGRVTYIGVVRRRLIPEKKEAGEKTGCRADVTLQTDEDGRAIAGACADNAWLRERLLNPPAFIPLR